MTLVAMLRDLAKRIVDAVRSARDQLQREIDDERRKPPFGHA
jgi:hypothetical protein